MLLRTRLTLFVTAAFVMTGLFIAITIASVGRLMLDQVDDLIEAKESALWDSTVRGQDGLMDNFASGLAEDMTFIDALKHGDLDVARKLLEAAHARHRLSSRPDRLEIASPDGQVTIRLPAIVTESSLLDQTALDKLASGARLTGLRASDAGHLYQIDAVPLRGGGQFIASLAVATDATRLISAFAIANQSSAALVALRGQLVTATDPALWMLVKDGISLRQPGHRLLINWPQVVSITSLPLRDSTGALTGTVVAYRDISEQFFAIASILAWAVGVVVVLVVLVALFLYWYVTASFRPLDRAVDVTRALAEGDTSQELETVGTDEIGRIGEAVRQLRVNALAAAEVARQRQRTRYRRERLIRREVGALADALDPDARAEILAVLAGGTPRHLAGDSAGPSSTSSSQQLRLIAGVLRDLVHRILDQRQTMTGMIAELEEALATKDKLLGLQHQLEIARQVQLAILPRDYGDDPRISIHGQMTPANEVGGDFYDCFMLDDRIMVMVVADVSGKGIPAALFMAVTRTLIRAVARFSVDPAALITEVNDLLTRENDQLLFVTACMGFLDLTSGRFRYVNAGHSSPIIMRIDGTADELPQAKGIALAVTDLVGFGMFEITLQPDEKLFFYTDGITEAQNPDGRLFGTERLLELLRRYSSLDESLLCEMIERDVRTFEGGLTATDDLTCLAVRFVSDLPARRARNAMDLPDKDPDVAS